MNRTSPYSKGKGSSKGKGDNGQSDKGKGAAFVRARTIRWAAYWRRQLGVNNDAELVDNNDEEPEQWMGRRVRFEGGCDMAIAFPQFARDEGLVCAVDDDGDSLVCWDSCPWNPMAVLRQPAGEGRDRRARGQQRRGAQRRAARGLSWRGNNREDPTV